MAQTFYTRPLLDIRPSFEDIEHGQTDDFDFMSVGSGAATPWKPTTKLRRRISLPFLMEGKAEFRALRDFFKARKGRREGFWLPTYLNDYWLVQDEINGATSVRIKRVGLANIVSPSNKTQFNFLALVTRSSIRAHEITNAVVSGDDEILTITPAVSGALVAKDTICCALLYARLDEEEGPQWDFHSDVAIRAELAFEELPMEYLFTDGGSGFTGSVHLGKAPIFLYELTRGGTVYRLANWGTSVDAGSETWISDNISHGDINSGLDFVADEVQLNLGTDRNDHPLRYYLDREGSEITTLKIFEVDESNLTFDSAAPLFSGRVDRTEFGNQGEITVSVSSLTRLASQAFPMIRFQRTCNHRLFDVNCAKLESDFLINGTISALSSDPPYLESAAIGTEVTARADANWFALGKIQVGTEIRLCVGTNGASRVYLNQPFKSAVVGAAVKALPGCDKRIGTCNGKYNNLIRTILFPYMPNANPNLASLMNPQPAGGKKS